MTNPNQQLSLDALLSIGKVISVKGRLVEVLVSKTKNSSILLYDGQIIKNVSVGSYVKIGKGFEELIGKIEGEYTTEDKAFNQKSYSNERDKIKRILSISLLGYLQGDTFRQGVKELPLIDNECFLLTQNELDGVHNFIKKINGVPDLKLKIGHLASETGKVIEVGINSLFASHIGIFGNTGSGKSYTLAGLYHKLFEQYKGKAGFVQNARFLLIDFNGEFIKEDTIENSDKTITDDNKNIFPLSTDRDGSSRKLIISHHALYNSTFWSILLQATEKTQAPFITSALSSKYINERISSDQGIIELIKSTIKLITTNITVNQEKNMVESFLDEIGKFNVNRSILGITELKQFYSEELKFFAAREDRRYYCMINGFTYNSNQDDGFYENVISMKVNQLIRVDSNSLTDLQRIKLIINFHYFYSIQKGHYQKEHIGHILGRLDTRIKDLDKLVIVNDQETTLSKPMNIVSLKDVNIHMRKLIPLLLCNQIYEEKKKENDNSKYLNIIIDEAHNILSTSSIRESETWKDYRLETFEEIIKEGRKFGVFLTISSQRPSDISDTIISQLHNYFIHRLINNRDIQAVERTISYLDKVSFEALPILPTGTCVLAGLCAHIPVIIEIDKIDDEFEPRNKTIKPTDFWE
ncbi:MAG: ATP-binding protein [Bacteroidetes bacterium]|nr:ATP-binding protein [Bacteroidota bacterium]